MPLTIEEQFRERLAQVDAEIAAVGFQNYKESFLSRAARRVADSHGPEFRRTKKVFAKRDRARDRARVREMKDKILSGEINLRQRSVDVRPTWKYKPAVPKAEPREWKVPQG